MGRLLELVDRVKSQNDSNSLLEIQEMLKGVIEPQIWSFSQNKVLSRVESVDSLRNSCLFKLFQACVDFKRDPQLSEEENERKMAGLAKTYMRNYLIDTDYSLKLAKRYPIKGLCSIDIRSDDDESTFSFLRDKGYTPFEVACFDEIIQAVMDELDGIAKEIFHLFTMSCTAEECSRRLGIPTSRVRGILNKKIRPKVKRYAKR